MPYLPNFFRPIFHLKKAHFSFLFTAKKGTLHIYILFLPVETRAMIFFLHKKNENLNLFVSNLPHNAYMVDFLYGKKNRRVLYI